MSTQTARDAIEHVLASPDADAIDGTATYCVGCGACAYFDPAFHIVRNFDGCSQAALDGEPGDWERVRNVCPFASAINEDDLGRGLFGGGRTACSTTHTSAGSWTPISATCGRTTGVRTAAREDLSAGSPPLCSRRAWSTRLSTPKTAPTPTICTPIRFPTRSTNLKPARNLNTIPLR